MAIDCQEHRVERRHFRDVTSASGFPGGWRTIVQDFAGGVAF